MPFPATCKQQRQDLRSQAKSGLIPLHLWKSPTFMSCLSKEDERGTPKGPYTTEYWDRVSPYCYVSTGVGDGDLDLGLSNSERLILASSVQ